jgi:hypothetical protein
MRLLYLMSLFAVLTVLLCCRQKGGNTSGNQVKIEPEDFLAMFHTCRTPLNFADSSLVKKNTDSSISWSVFTQFIPDSLIQKYFGRTTKPRLYAFGKLLVKDAETYLFIKALTPGKKILFVVCMNRDGKFETGMPVLIREDESEFHYTASVDNKFTISVIRSRKDSDGRLFFVRTVYVFNAEGVFTLIMTESNEGKPRMGQIYNPIDTLAHKHKFTGDYILDKRNFISFRDGKNSSVVRFFVHFEKDNGNCKGELKGEAHFVSSTVARYIANGDPCRIEFSFSEKNVRMKEQEGCGNHRDIRCYFDGVYIKHKETNSKSSKIGR